MARTDSPADYLHRFGLSSFRRGQEDVIGRVLAGEDVLCVMPTGGGKSLCYQLPAVMMGGLTIVVSPLIALMQDQVDTLLTKGVRATLINSSLNSSEQFDRMARMAQGEYDLVYIAPERLRNQHFLESIRKTKVSLLAIDEAHCISEWGHDFRPDYARLGQFRVRNLGGVQTIALTATATQAVREDIVKLLSLHNPKPFVTGFARDNLYFSVQQCGNDREKDERLLRTMQSQNGVGIVYAATRKRCEELAQWLPQRLGRPVGIYHGGLDSQSRRSVQEDFMAGKLAAIVATNAFGMGIDKSDIRYVVHYNMPGSLEAYYQEAGRAGRDGKPSMCLLLFSYADRYVQEFFIENNYPTPELVLAVYNFLLSQTVDPIELTLDEIREKIRMQVGTEAIGTAERMLAKTGVLERLASNQNQAIVRIDSELPTLVDLLPREARKRRRVLQAIEKIVGDRRGEDVFFSLDPVAKTCSVSRDVLTRNLRELCELRDFDYVPPFRGRAVHFRRRDVAFDDLEIDFDELQRRKKAEYGKLDQVIQFARTPYCRQLAILQYFGDPAAADCGNCDRCGPKSPQHAIGIGTAADLAGGLPAQQPAGASSNDDPKQRELLTRVVRIVLSGLARTHGRIGKGLVAQMLAGSQNKKLQQLRLDRLSTYGLLRGLKQSQVSQLVDAVCNTGMAQQIEVTKRRPTVKLTTLGEQVMKGSEPLPAAFVLPKPLLQRALAAVQSIEPSDKEAQESAADDSTSPQSDPELLKTLRKWRLEFANSLDVPAYRVFSNRTLEAIATAAPTTLSELEAIDGVSQQASNQCGYAVLQAIAEHRSGNSKSHAASPTLDSPPISDQGPADVSEATPYDPGSDDFYDQLNTDQTSETDASRASVTQANASKASANQASVSQRRDQAPEDVVLRVDPSLAQQPLGKTATKSAVEQSDDEPPDAIDAYWTWRLLNDGYSADHCCRIRRIDPEQMVAHLIEAARRGRPIDLRWVTGDDPQLIQQLSLATQATPRHSAQSTNSSSNTAESDSNPPGPRLPAKLVQLALLTRDANPD